MRQPDPGDESLQTLRELRFLERCCEFRDEAPDAIQVEGMPMQNEQAFDVLLVLRPERDALVDDEILGACDGNLDTSHVEALGGSQSVALEGQPGDRQIDVDAARAVAEEEHLARGYELGGIIDARNQIVLAQTGDQIDWFDDSAGDGGIDIPGQPWHASSK